MADGTTSSSSSGMSTFLKVVGIGCLGFIALGFACTVIVTLNAKKWMANAAKGVAVNVIQNSEIDEEQKTLLVGRLDEVTQQFIDGDIEFEQLGMIFEELAEGPMFMTGWVMSAHRHLIAESEEASDQEKLVAELHFQRVARGVAEGKIGQRPIEKMINPYVRRGGGSNSDFDFDIQGDIEEAFRHDLDAEERAELIAEAKEIADEAEIPVEPYIVDYAAIFEQAVQSALSREPGTRRDDSQGDEPMGGAIDEGELPIPEEPAAEEGGAESTPADEPQAA